MGKKRAQTQTHKEPRATGTKTKNGGAQITTHTYKGVFYSITLVQGSYLLLYLSNIMSLLYPKMTASESFFAGTLTCNGVNGVSVSVTQCHDHLTHQMEYFTQSLFKKKKKV